MRSDLDERPVRGDRLVGILRDGGQGRLVLGNRGRVHGAPLVCAVATERSGRNGLIDSQGEIRTAEDGGSRNLSRR